MTRKLWGKEERHDGDCNEEETDCFFESLDRVPSGISFDADFPSSGSDEDDLRISFASAISPPSESRRFSLSDDIDDEGKGYDYGLWMAEPISIKERRRRLLQGMGLASGKGLSFCSGGSSVTIAPERAISHRILPADNDPQAVAEAVSRVIARCKSDTQLAAVGRRSELSRSSSAPPSLLDLRGSPPISRPRTSLERGQFGDGSSGGAADGGSDLVIIKNLDTGKEFVVSELGKDGTWGRLNDLQTGLQLTLEEFETFLGYSPIVKELMRRANLGGDRRNNESAHKAFGAKSSKQTGRKKGNWLKNIKFVASSVTGLISDKEKGEPGGTTSGKSSGTNSSNSSERLKVHQHGKSYKELTGLYMSQEIHAHQGSIWSIKFSSDSRYLASAGEDRIVHVWQVLEGNALSSSFRQQEGCSPPPHPSLANGSPDNRSALLGVQPCKTTRGGKSNKKSIPDYIVMPETIFSLSEKPICSFQGHLDDVLDLSWSKSQYLLSASMDKTVRLWDMESETCLKLFAHNDYVTSIQFNPVDDRYFISGSLDAKVRIWSILERQVVDWSDLHEMVTATCYTPDGQGALVGSHKGSCRFYKTSDRKLYQEAQIDICNKKRKSHGKKITGFQFAPGNLSEVLITSADSQIRVFDGINMVHKFRGFRNTSSQILASYTSDGKYVVCASEDSHVYIWKREANRGISAGGKNKTWTTTRSHEHFYCKDVSVAIPWPGCGSNYAAPSLSAWSGGSNDNHTNSESLISNLEDVFPSSRSHCPSLPKKSSSEQTLLSSEELCDISHSRSGTGNESFVSASSVMHSGVSCSSISDSTTFSSSRSSWGWYSGNSTRTSSNEPASAWGLVVVTAGLGGDIRIYQNFGLPLRLGRQSNLFY